MSQLTNLANGPRLLIAVAVLLTLTTTPTSVRAGGPIKEWSGIHLGNRPSSDWDSALLARIDGDNGGIWPNAVVFLSSQLYTLSRDANCRIKTGANDVTTTGRPVLLSYLQRASQNSVRIIIRIHPSPGNFDTDHRLISGPIAGIGYCDPSHYRPAFDIADEMDAIHNYNQAHSITEWGFEPANEPNIEWYTWNDAIQPNYVEAWQDMQAYFQTVWFNKASGVRALTPPMAQSVFAENNFTDANAIDPNKNPWEWCGEMRLKDGTTTGYGVMQSYYTNYNDGVSWHNYWRLGFEASGSCALPALHVSYFFPDWMKTMLEQGAKVGVITEADLFSYGADPYQDDWQPLHNKDDNSGRSAASSIRAFFDKEIRGRVVVAWLLNDNVNDSNQDHNWHEAYNDQWGNYERPWFTQWWPNPERPTRFLPLVVKQHH
ncbi:MAG: hypothetical protein CVU38_04050 [Chloroflexi bacterium HGW-Chloroflexi-1]|nr:MAG: hypothetical protein CVU38_04050 [Chloroflexi bacterium HGW-Chloroflexi-1]